MLDTATKRRIDTARDILVGKVPDPKSQVEQITIALIYKFMDDMDAEAEELGGKRKFFTGDFARYGWAKLMSAGIGGHELIGLYGEGITTMPQNPGIPALFREIFKNAYLPYRDPETLKSFLKIIDEFSYDHSERLGDAFEYLLSVLGSQGDAGQFRTPRHIIDFIVEVMVPKKGEVILDPACGTAGFLISAYKHILRTNTDTNNNSTLTPDERGRLATNFKGYDISPDMVRLSLVNLYLHGFTDPHIFEYDSLTSEERWNEYADVILANPPFMSPKGGIKPHKLFSITTKRSEVLFLDYIIEHLTSTGRAGIIIPEGIHFVAQGGHTQLRRTLIDKGFLLADITLPHGVFKPYASVKTHILIIDRGLCRQSDSVLFIEIDNDGFSQSDTRDPIAGSQLDAALKHIESFKKSICDKQHWERPNNDLRSYAISKAVLSGGKNVHLLGRWHDLPNRVIHRKEVPLMRIDELCEIRDGLSPNMATQPGNFVMVVPAEDRKSADHWSFEGKAVCIPLVSSAGHGKADIKRIHYQEGQFALANTMCALFVKDETVIHPKYLHIFLSAMSQELLVPLMCGATNVTMNSSQLADVMIPVPKITLQEEVIESDLINTKAAAMTAAAAVLRDSSSDKDIVQLAERVIRETETLLKAAKKRINISAFLPS
ncbi:MAG: N-6 DNA methylase [Methylobacter sp.]|uniref:N-6 DNA methylase n=1 Tax=Methylobacter sp. TaxID=2051955 RepID=UPI00273190C0|nr:N-6 DNA methylase [Methylobacter sp.]MDP1663868.1 N-6 DNA methylase [Methylobacter sp.]